MDISNNSTIMTDIFIFLDTSWEYYRVVDYLNYVVNRLNIHPHGSSVTLLSARDGSIMVNRTFSITDFYAKWNASTHSCHRNGFSLPIILSKSRDLAEDILNADHESGSLGGRSLISLIVPSPIAFVHEYDFYYCENYIQGLNSTIPDLKIIFYAGGAVIRFMEYVSNPREDLYLLDSDRSVEQSAVPVIKRIQRIQRRLTNPRCNTLWISESQGSNNLIQHLDLGKINFYRMSANFFYNEGSMRYMKVKPISSIAFIICTSRKIALPYRNPMSPFTEGQDCKQITSNDFSYDLTEMCMDYDNLLECPPLYISVQSQGFAEISQVSCSNEACPTPISAQYSILVNNLDCSSSGYMYFGNAFLIIGIMLLALIN